MQGKKGDVLHEVINYLFFWNIYILEFILGKIGMISPKNNIKI